MGDGDASAAQRSTESPPLATQFREQVAAQRQSTSISTSFLRRIFNTKPAVAAPSDRSITDGGASSIRDETSTGGSSSSRNNSGKDPSDVDPTKVHGFHRQALLLQQYLVAPDSNEFKSAAIFGVAGVGKTTLCQLVFNDQQVIRQKYFPRIWVTLSSETANDTETVVKRLLEELGVDDDIISSVSSERKLAGLIYAMFVQLTGKPYLVVLDGVGEADNRSSGDQFSHGFPKGCGGAVLITTRSEDAAKKMAGPEGFLYHLHPLSDPNSCWLIYKDSVLTPEDEDEASEEVKHELMNKSGGLPSALVMLREIKRAATPTPVDLDQNSSVAASHRINHVDVKDLD